MNPGNEQDPAAYAVALNELAQLKLSEGFIFHLLSQGKTAEAQDLFRKALGIQQQQGLSASGEAPAVQASEADPDHWETRWDSGQAAAVVSSPVPSSGAASVTSSRPAPRQGGPAPSSSSSSSAGPRRAAGATAASPAPPTANSGAGAGGAAEVPFGGAHILEIHGLDNSVKTTHLEKFLAQLLPNPEVPPVLKWVDDYRALALFANPRQAQAALTAAADLQPAPGQQAYSLRRWADASALSRAMPAAELAAPKPRPLTTSTVARRLIGGALGGGMTAKLRDREEERVLAAARRELRAAEEKRREKLDEAWED